MLETVQAADTTGAAELEIRHICQAYPRPSGAPAVVLDDINLTLRAGEIVGVLGRSGCGKSTLLRIVAGLAAASSGEVRHRGSIVHGPAAGVAMVFQTFALFPWLTVLDNVQAGLDAIGVPEAEARKRALAAIDLIGLDGFESAYPREISGGMRQRVGFARAMVVQPTVLLMDEPFSALDVLTGETLRGDFIDLWTTGKMPTKAVLLVTHNIEEAVFMCDRILILSSNPGRVAAEVEVPLPRPRQRLNPAFRDVVDDIYSRMTAGPVPADGTQPTGMASIATRLPSTPAMRIIDVIDALGRAPFNGQVELSTLSNILHVDGGGVLRLAELTRMMGFAELRGSVLHLTAAGHALAEEDAVGRKRIFGDHLLRSVPLAAHICHVLSERPGHKASRIRFVEELEDHLSPHDAERTLNAVIDWGRYAECFAYNDAKRRFSLENPE